MNSAGATLQGSFSGATGTIRETGFEWGTSADDLSNTLTASGSVTGTSGSFSAALGSRAASTTYYYRAYVLEWVSGAAEAVYRYGSVRSFTTSAPSAYTVSGWLEMPAVTGSENFVGTFYGSGGETDANRNYSYNYSYDWYASLWVAYPLSASQTSGDATAESWAYNPKVESSRQVKVRSGDGSYPSMYGADAYSRGHQCPAADRKSDNTMRAQTYYVTNQTPQLQQKFNGSIWGKLEHAERALVSGSSETIYVVTGPAYRKKGGSETVTYLTGASGKNASPASLPVPNYYWKAFLRVKWSDDGKSITSASTIGFWFEHKEYESTDSFTSYACSVKQIESWTGFNLFTNLPDDLEETAENNTDWPTFQRFK